MLDALTSKAGPVVRGADGVEIATWDLGGKGPPLLLAHATGFHGRCWLPLGPVLTDHFHVWAYDHRGHGTSGHSTSGEYRDWSHFADDCLAVVEHLGVRGCYGAGHSLGGAILLLAEQARVGTFASLYCYEPVVVPDSVVEARGRNVDLAGVARKRRKVFADRRTAWENYRSKQPFATFDDEALRCYVAYGFVDRPEGTVTLACSSDEEATVYEGALHASVYRRLPTLQLPVTVAVAGRQSDLGDALLADVAGRIPHGRLERAEGLSHFGPMEDPGRVARDMTAALLDSEPLGSP